MIQMVLQYEVNETAVQEYKQAISQILSKLPSFEANNIQLNESHNMIIESYYLPTESHYYALKKLRTSKNHFLFGSLDPFIKGGLKQMGCYAIKQNH